jgi:DNA-binding MarR family transcriptional regulator
MIQDADRDDFIETEGVFFFAHLLRRVSDQIVGGCEQWYATLGLRVAPRTASTLHLLYRRGPQSVTELAALLRQSHPLAVQWTRQLVDHGMIETKKDGADRRRTIVSLTPAGIAEVERMLGGRAAFEAAYASLAKDADADVFDALWRVEKALRSRSFADRLKTA